MSDLAIRSLLRSHLFLNRHLFLDKATEPEYSAIKRSVGYPGDYPGEYPDSKVMMNFQLREDASRRTKQRYRAHQAGTCNNKCRWCRQQSSWVVRFSPKKEANNAWEPANNKQAENRLRRPNIHREVIVTDLAPENTEVCLPTAYDVLEQETAKNYRQAARRVAPVVATVEVNTEAMIPGMMVWHRYEHVSCILLEQTEDGVWSIQRQDGVEEHGVRAAILTPIQPNFLIRAWTKLASVAHNVFYPEVETKTEAGFITQREFNSKIVAVALLAMVLALLASGLSL